VLVPHELLLKQTPENSRSKPIPRIHLVPDRFSARQSKLVKGYRNDQPSGKRSNASVTKVSMPANLLKRHGFGPHLD
jgi:hypothetical protein